MLFFLSFIMNLEGSGCSAVRVISGWDNGLSCILPQWCCLLPRQGNKWHAFTFLAVIPMPEDAFMYVILGMRKLKFSWIVMVSRSRIFRCLIGGGGRLRWERVWRILLNKHPVFAVGIDTSPLQLSPVTLNESVFVMLHLAGFWDCLVSGLVWPG